MQIRKELSIEETVSAQEKSLQLIEPYVNQILPVNKPYEPTFITARKYVAGKLFGILNMLAHHLPDKRTINVASLKNCTPDDFLAIKLFYDRKYGSGNYELNYFTFHTDRVEQENNQKAYKNFPELRNIVCDPTDKAAMTTAMIKAGICQNGFDIVLLRHFKYSPFAPIYAKMMNDVIPFIAAKDAKVLFTFYHVDEKSLAYVRKNVGQEYESPLANGCQLSYGFAIRLSGGEVANPDFYSAIMCCQGRAFDNKLVIASKTTSPLVRLSVLTTEKPAAQQQLLKEIQELNTTHSLPEKNAALLLEALNKAEYNKALRMLCGEVLVDHVRTLLRYKDVFNINVKEVPASGKNALARLQESQLGMPEQKAEIVDLLRQCDATLQNSAP